jgi:hypothetical protein
MLRLRFTGTILIGAVIDTQHLFGAIPSYRLTWTSRRSRVSDFRFRFPVLLLWVCAAGANADATAESAPATAPRMTVVVGKDVSGTVYKKLGLPNRQYCWDNCLKDDRCSGVRWGVVAEDTAGMCILLTGSLSLKDLAEPKTEDGKPIHVTGARKETVAGSGT